MRRSESASSGSRDDPSNLVLRTMRWGLVPSWSKHEDKTRNTINARSENLVEGGGMWGSIKGKKRCVVLCQGYYEWLKKGKDRLPHFVKHKDGEQGKLMLLAGLYDCTVLEGSTEPLWTFTIVTTSACSEFSWLHDRQPVILSSRAELDTWLDTSSQTWTPTLTKLVESYDNSVAPLECYQVPKEVGKVGAESPTFIEPVAHRKDGIQAMFSRQKQAQSSPLTKKRKRSSSPGPSNAVVELNDDANETATAVEKSDPNHASDSPTRKGKKLHVMSPSAARRTKGKNARAKGDSSTADITQFFSRT